MSAATTAIPETLQAGLNSYCDHVRSIAAARLQSIIVFGVVLTDNWQPQQDRIEHALVIAEDDLDLISGFAKLDAFARKLPLAAPLILTPQRIIASKDTFPLEWLEIASCHEVVYGSDPFTALELAREPLRLQCERESRIATIGLRQRLVQSGSKQAEVPMREVAEQAIRVLRGLLRLFDRQVPAAPSAVITAAESLLEIDLQPIRQAFARQTGLPLVKALHGVLSTIETRSDRA
jgi:hypothetical protein